VSGTVWRCGYSSEQTKPTVTHRVYAGLWDRREENKCMCNIVVGRSKCLDENEVV